MDAWGSFDGGNVVSSCFVQVVQLTVGANSKCSKTTIARQAVCNCSTDAAYQRGGLLVDEIGGAGEIERAVGGHVLLLRGVPSAGRSEEVSCSRVYGKCRSEVGSRDESWGAVAGVAHGAFAARLRDRQKLVVELQGVGVASSQAADLQIEGSKRKGRVVSLGAGESAILHRDSQCPDPEGQESQKKTHRVEI